jgi:hypothetical protein
VSIEGHSSQPEANIHETISASTRAARDGAATASSRTG